MEMPSHTVLANSSRLCPSRSRVAHVMFLQALSCRRRETGEGGNQLGLKRVGGTEARDKESRRRDHRTGEIERQRRRLCYGQCTSVATAEVHHELLLRDVIQWGLGMVSVRECVHNGEKKPEGDQKRKRSRSLLTRGPPCSYEIFLYSKMVHEVEMEMLWDAVHGCRGVLGVRTRGAWAVSSRSLTTQCQQLQYCVDTS